MMDPLADLQHHDQQESRSTEVPTLKIERDEDTTSETDHQSEPEDEDDSDAESYGESHVLIKRLIESVGEEVFQRVNEIDSAVCPPCINIICAFSDNLTPIRTPGKPSESSLLHHKTMKGLVECSTTCRMCALILRVLDIGHSQFNVLAKSPDPAEKELVHIRDRDYEAFEKTLGKPEYFLWKRKPWGVITKLASAYLEKLRGGTAVIEGYGFGMDEVDISGDRENLLTAWAEELYARNPAAQNSLVIWDAMIDLLDTAQRLKERYRLQEEVYNLKEVIGYKAKPVELQVVYGTERYPARVFAPRDDQLSMNHLGRPVNQNANSPETFELMTTWFTDCLSGHPECDWAGMVGDEDPILPSRVIDIGVSDDSVPRLLVSTATRGKWATLSHRWGDVGIFKCTKSNVEQLQAIIELASLPATFRDAIIITRQIGLRYLWIDSLCIIQDSPQDWLKEAASMPNIYRNACVTIAAAATENSNGGIFVDRVWTPHSKPAKLPIPLKDKRGEDMHCEIYLDVSFDANLEKKETNHLRSRAWCFQESQLSHRRLTFDALQMSYTCVRHGLVESREVPPVLAREERNTFLEQFQGGKDVLPAGDKTALRKMIISWYDLIYNYTRRDLSFSNDKLVAISGIANIVGTCIQDEYCAGLWRNDMPRALLWSPYEEETLPNPPHEVHLPPLYRAPSWSWASIDGPISCFICRERLPNPPIATILEVQTILLGPDIYGQVSAGFLKINAPVKHAVIGKVSKVWPYQLLLGLDGGEEDDITHAVFDTTEPDEGMDVWCLQITDVYGLLLVKAEEKMTSEHVYGEEIDKKEHEMYSRIGVFHLRTTDHLRRPWFAPEDTRTLVII